MERGPGQTHAGSRLTRAVAKRPTLTCQDLAAYEVWRWRNVVVLVSRQAATECSPGRKPRVGSPQPSTSPRRGRPDGQAFRMLVVKGLLCRPLRGLVPLVLAYPGLTPGATFCRRFAALQGRKLFFAAAAWGQCPRRTRPMPRTRELVRSRPRRPPWAGGSRPSGSGFSRTEMATRRSPVGVFRKAVASQPKAGESRPNAGRSWPKVGESRPNAGHSAPKVGNPPPNVRRSSPKAGESRPNAGGSWPNVGK